MTQIGEGVFVPPEPAEDEKEKTKDDKKVKIRCCVFFDGTLNNRINIDHRVSESEIYEKYGGGDNSYEGDYTNVAKMERYIDAAEGYDFTFSVYVEGPGTVDEQSDKAGGYLMGTGISGVTRKVEKAIGRILTKISTEVARGTGIELLTLDVFGFSRGAAGARNFIYRCFNAVRAGRGGYRSRPFKDGLALRGYLVDKVEVSFAGLYDTVSSHGFNFSNDTGTLNLDAVAEANMVVQLAAAEEHRSNFALTSIESAGDKGKEFFLPGVHSDIGGGYRDNVSENQVIYKCTLTSTAETEKKRLVESGWYRESDIEIQRFGFDVLMWVKRGDIRNTYSRIPLHIMAGYAREGCVNIKNKLERDEGIHEVFLNKVKSLLEDYLDECVESAPEDWHHSDSWLFELRRKYLHFSARFSTGHGPRFVDGKRRRQHHYG